MYSQNAGPVAGGKGISLGLLTFESGLLVVAPGMTWSGKSLLEKYIL